MNLTRSHQEKCKASQNFQETLNRLVLEQQSVYHLSFSPSEKLTEISKFKKSGNIKQGMVLMSIR